MTVSVEICDGPREVQTQPRWGRIRFVAGSQGSAKARNPGLEVATPSGYGNASLNQFGYPYNPIMKIKVVIHEAEEGGFWAEVPAIPGCATQGETFEELLRNLYEAIEGCLSVDISPAQVSPEARVLEIAV